MNKDTQSTTNNFSIHRFMTDTLGLRGSELLVYALIYSFSRGGGEYNGTRQYLADCCGLSSRSVDRALASLLNGGYIQKTADKTKFSTFRYKICSEALTGKGGFSDVENSEECDVMTERQNDGVGASFCQGGVRQSCAQ